MKKVVKTIGVLSVASLMSTSAFSQISISGYAEVGFMTGSTQGTRSTGLSKNLGGESVITVAGKGSLNNGWTYSAYQNLDSDDMNNGRELGNVSPMTTRAIVLSPSKDLNLFYTYDGVYGGEIARTAVPTVTERAVDLTGQSTLAEFIDVTSGGHAVGFEVLNVGPAGRLSVAYNPNLDATQSMSSDRVYAATNYNTGGRNTAAGYSIGYSVTPGPIKVAVGYTKIEDTDTAAAVDPTSKTLGVTYTASSFAIGAQRTKNSDGAKKSQTTPFEDKVDTISASFAASKEFTLGAAYSKMEREVPGSVTGPDTKVLQLVAAYNLGPVVASISYEDATDKNQGANAVSISGTDSTLTKIKVKANF